jgi:protein-disulfide isomerase
MAKKSTIGKQSGGAAPAAGGTGGLSRNALLLIGAGVVLVFALVIIFQQTAVRGNTAAITGGPTTGKTSERGPADAKVTVAVYSDFQCPHCKTYVESVEKQLLAEYVDTGKVHYDYRHYIVISRESADAANASECAAEQGFFWAYHDLLFDQQGVQGRDTVSKTNLKAFGKRIEGLNLSQFDACVDSGKYIEQVYREMQTGTDKGVTGTPAVFVNDKKLDNGQDYQVVKAAIEAALAN